MAASRFPFAMSRDQLLPGILKKVHPRFLTPFYTILLTGLVMALVITFLNVEKIAKLASAFQVLMYMFVNASVIVLRETGVQWYKPPFRSPFYPFVQLFGIFSGFVLLAYLGILSIAAIILVSILGAVIYKVYGSRASRNGVLKLYGHRPALYLLYKRKKTDLQPAATNWAAEKIKAANLAGALAENAQVVVPLFGNERSPEMLVEMGAALSKNGKVQVLHLTEVPDQTMLDAMLDDDVHINSLKRRIRAMVADRALDVDFDAVVTHELVETIHAISSQTNCRWLVMDWHGRSRQGILVRNPIGWLLTNVNSNFALFKDNGVRYIRRVLVCLRPGKNDIHFVTYADRIARFHKAELTLMRVVPEDVSAEEFSAIQQQSEALIEGCQSPHELVLVKGKHPVKIISEASAGFDLLITGTPLEGSWRQIIYRRARDKFVESAVCSVLRLTVHVPEDAE
jgi:hypothetical protein